MSLFSDAFPLPVLFEFFAIFSTVYILPEVGSAACFSGPQYTIPQLCNRSAQSAITQCFQICQCAMRNAAIADTSTMHNHSKKKNKVTK
jgi:hypothetical protein